MPKNLFVDLRKKHTRNTNRSICLRTDDDATYVTSPLKFANTFVDYFSRCYSPSHQSVQPQAVKTNCHDFLTSIKVDETEIAEVIKQLKPKLSTSADCIPSFIIKGCCDVFIPVLLHIFNLSLSTGVFTSMWKEAVVVPISKGGDGSVTSNCRPMSLLYVF